MTFEKNKILNNFFKVTFSHTINLSGLPCLKVDYFFKQLSVYKCPIFNNLPDEWGASLAVFHPCPLFCLMYP